MEMIKTLISHLSGYAKSDLWINDPDGFLLRKDVQEALRKQNITIVLGTPLEKRIHFELHKGAQKSWYVVGQNEVLLEDMSSTLTAVTFTLSQLLPSLHIPSIIELELAELDQLLQQNYSKPLGKEETVAFIHQLSEPQIRVSTFDPQQFVSEISELRSIEDWSPDNCKKVISTLSKALLKSINSEHYFAVKKEIDFWNQRFQDELETSYQALKNANPLKRPRLVSHILEHIAGQGLHCKAALVVVDGLAWWQYELLKEQMLHRFCLQENTTYAWLPTITQLSRQAIFKAANPSHKYIQSPKNEDKMWSEFWQSKGVANYQVQYTHEPKELAIRENITKFALVLKDLDEKMHSSTDYADLLNLTQNWIDRSCVIEHIDQLVQKGFAVYLTSDHGNVHTQGWRNLNSKEKLGANRSGSRSQRHIEYEKEYLASEFLNKNNEVKEWANHDQHIIYCKGDVSFSKHESLVSHGGSHLLEVIIPFCKITNESK